jgi:hypothetical protein
VSRLQVESRGCKAAIAVEKCIGLSDVLRHESREILELNSEGKLFDVRGPDVLRSHYERGGKQACHEREDSLQHFTCGTESKRL